MVDAERHKRKKLLTLLKIGLALAILLVILGTAKVRDHLTLPPGAPYAGTHVGWIQEESEEDKERVLFRNDEGFIFEATLFDGKVERATLAGAEGKVHAFSTAEIQGIEIRPGLVAVVKKIDWQLWLLSLMIYFLGITLTATRWWLLLKASGLPQTLIRAFRLTYIGNFFNNVVPGQTGGDLVRAYYIARENPAQKTDSILTVIVDRMLGITALACIGAAIISFNLKEYGQDNALLIYGFISLVGVGGCVFFSKRLRRFFQLKRLFSKLPFQRFFQRVDQSIFLYRYKKKSLLVTFLLSFLIHLILITSIWVLGRGLQIDLPLLAYIAYIPVIFIISSIPLTPAGWGVGEACFAYFFCQLGGASYVSVVALSIVFRLSATLLSLLGGIFLLSEKNRIHPGTIDLEQESDSEKLAI